MSRVGLFLSALYAAVIVICLAFAYDAGSDFKGQYVFLQLPIALQSSLLQWLDHTSSIEHLSWAAAYLLFGLPTFALLYLVGWLIERCRSNLPFKRDVELGLSHLPKDLLIPIDDGAAAHLIGLQLPHLELPSTDGFSINLAGLRGRWVIYIYPMTGRPDVPLPDGWDGIPGARGCTPQSCGFRDHYSELASSKTSVFGLSVQPSAYQFEARDRLHLPFELLSDAELKLKALLQLPTFTVAGRELYKRLTMIIEDGVIVKVFYPVFPPDRNANEVLAWLRRNA
jgi:peroxiredoxin